MAISTDRVEASLLRTQRRRELARGRAGRQRRISAVLLGLLLIAGGLWAVSKAANGPVGPAPRFLVTWPKPNVQQLLPTGSTVLVRRGQPFNVSLEGADNYDLQWRSDGVSGSGAETRWAPNSETSVLTVQYRPRVDGWRRFFAWIQRPREARLFGIHGKRPAGANSADFTLMVEPKALERGWVWLSPQVGAATAVRWDERAIHLLESASDAVPFVPSQASQPTTNQAALVPPPRVPRWLIVKSLDPRSPSSAPGDDATYAELNAADALSSQFPDNLARMAFNIAQNDSTLSIKLFARTGGAEANGVLRLAFDGRGSRAGWIKKISESEATTFEWWNRNPDGSSLSPATPNS